jgi:hypothetical protein
MSVYALCNIAGNLCSRRAIDVIILLDAFGHNSVVSVPRNVYKFEVLLHVCSHPRRVAGQFLMNIFLKSGPFLMPQFLDLCVRVARQSQCVCPPAPKGVCVDSFD